MRGEIMLSDRLNKLIRERGLSQADFLQLIKNSGVKVSQAAVSKWLGGQTKSIKAEILLPLSVETERENLPQSTLSVPF